MPKQRVVWTLVPNGRAAPGGPLRASIVVSPRLQLAPAEAPRTLELFSAWRDWPATLAQAIEDGTIQIKASSAPQPLQVKVTSKLDSGVWAAVFPETTPVTPWAFDPRGFVGRTILSYPVRTVADLVERLYGEVAVDLGASLPERDGLGGLLGARLTAGLPPGLAAPRQYAPLPQKQVLGRLREEKPRGQSTGAAAGIRANPAYALDLVQAYHAPLEAEIVGDYPDGAKPAGYDAAFPGAPSPYRHGKWRTVARTPLPAPADFDESLDFHARVAAVMEYRELARVCGLVLDVEFDAPPAAANLELGLVVDWPAGSIGKEPDITPSTAVRLSDAVFDAAPRSPTSPIVGRYLRVTPETHTIVQMDVDGAGIKLANTAMALSPTRGVRGSYTDETEKAPGEEAATAGLPTLRTGGLMLAEHRRDVSVSAALARAAALQAAATGAGAPPTLHAEDMVAGYRVDVRDLNSPDKAWRSLYARTTTVGFVNEPARDRLSFEGEGVSNLAVGESADGSNADIAKLHEGLATWTGWSLAAPEPGKLIHADDKVGDDREAVPPGLPLQVSHAAAKGSLPRLRFGHRYEMRVRLVDLAGNSAPVGQTDAATEALKTAAVTYTRHEPVDPPSLALVGAGPGAEPLEDGESMARMAIRTFNDNPEVVPPAAGAPRRRHVIPPRVSQRFAETHGVFDDPATGRPRPEVYAQIVGRDPLAAPNPSQPAGLTPPPGVPVSPIREIEIDRNKTSGAAPERYAVADPDFAYPFLPDPMAVAVSIRIYGLSDISPETLYTMPLYGAGEVWPNARPFRIEVVEAAGANNTAQPLPGAGVFRVGLRKGERARLVLRSKVPVERIDSLAVFGMMRRHIVDVKKRPASLADEAKGRIADGDHWMFTPPRTVEVVHAVQRPLIAPDIAGAQISRTRGQANGLFRAQKVRVDGKTTAKLDVDARWRDPIDDVRIASANVGPVAREASGPVTKRELGRLETPGQVLASLEGAHVLPDTRARRIVYTATGTTRFGDFMPAALRADADRLVRASPPVVAWAENTAPPPPPDVLYVVPTFGWTTTTSTSGVRQSRQGGGLRVYLGRPWLSTGFTEMLGVVLAPQGVSEDAFQKRYAASVTRWGGDPIRLGAAATVTARAPRLEDFTLRRIQGPITWEGTGLPAEEGETPGGAFAHAGLPHPEFLSALDDPNPANRNPLPLDVAPHLVGYDADRKLWYADIVVRPPDAAYFPFIQLALARYNPISVLGAHLSDIVLSDIQQLVPDRLVIVTRLANGARARIAVHGHGGTPPDAAPTIPTMVGAGSARFAVETQVLDAGADPDLGWRTVTPPPPPPPPSATPGVGRQGAVAVDPGSLSGVIAGQSAVLDANRIRDVRVVDQLPLADLNPPPKLWEIEVQLPSAPTGGKRRLLVTEREFYDRDPTPRIEVGLRIIYMAAPEV